MNIDDKIREQLERENALLKSQIQQDPSLFAMLASAYRGRLGGWMILMSLVGLLLTGLMLWCGYEFFFVESSLEAKLHWGVGLLLSAMMQIAIKMWSFNEMNRNAMQREIKKLELTVERLTQNLAAKD